MLIVANDYRSADVFKHARVMHLLLVLVKRIRDENRWARRQHEVGDGHRARARNHQISAMQGAGNIVDKRDDLRGTRNFAISVPHQPLIRIPRLMDNVQLYNTFSPDFESIYDTNIQTMRT